MFSAFVLGADSDFIPPRPYDWRFEIGIAVGLALFTIGLRGAGLSEESPQGQVGVV